MREGNRDLTSAGLWNLNSILSDTSYNIQTIVKAFLMDSFSADVLRATTLHMQSEVHCTALALHDYKAAHAELQQ